MESNPYSPPQAAVDVAPELPAGALSFADLVREARRLATQHWGLVFFGSAFVCAIKEGVLAILNHAYDTADDVEKLLAVVRANPGDLMMLVRPFLQMTGRTLGIAILYTVLTAGFEAGLIRLYMAAIRGEPLKLSTATRGLTLTLTCGAASVAWYLGFTLGIYACVLPGLFFGVMLAWAPYFVADEEVGPGEALARSWALSRAQPGRAAAVVLGTLLASGVLAFGGIAGRFVGTIIADLFYNVAFALLSGRAVTAQAVQEERFSDP